MAPEKDDLPQPEDLGTPQKAYEVEEDLMDTLDIRTRLVQPAQEAEETGS